MKKIPGISSRKRKLWLLISLGIIVVLIVAGIAVAIAYDSGDYNMPWTTGAGDNSGGGERTSGIPYDYKLTDVVGQTAPGSASSTNYHLTSGFLSIMPIDTGTGTMVKVYVALQGANRPSPEGWQVPITVGFFEPGDDVLLDTPIYSFSGTTTAVSTAGGTRAYFQCPDPVAPGTYDITADSSTTLLNVKRSVYIE